MISITSLIPLLVLLSVLLGSIRQRTKRIMVAKLPDIFALLDPPGSHIPDLLVARARANSRLVDVFGLQNAFVSGDGVVRKRFLAQASEILRRHAQNFAAFPDRVHDVVAGSALRLRSLAPSRSRHPSIPFSNFIQVVTLRVVVGSLLGGNIPEDSDKGTIFVVETINELWTLSKKSHAAPATLLESLNTHLHEWMPERYERPLDFVIPTYETMWRILPFLDHVSTATLPCSHL